MLSTDPEMKRLSNWHRSTKSLSRQAIAVGMQKVMVACAVCDAIIADMRRLWPQLNTFLVVGGGAKNFPCSENNCYHHHSLYQKFPRSCSELSHWPQL